MQIENDYDREVYNGDIGFIAWVDAEAGEIAVGFDGREVVYSLGELDALVPAYAATIHNSQGSEYPAVVIQVLTQHYVMLQRNLLYTGITRGRRLVVLVGSRRAVAIAVRNVSGRRRWSKLREWVGRGRGTGTIPARSRHSRSFGSCVSSDVEEFVTGPSRPVVSLEHPLAGSVCCAVPASQREHGNGSGSDRARNNEMDATSQLSNIRPSAGARQESLASPAYGSGNPQHGHLLAAACVGSQPFARLVEDLVRQLPVIGQTREGHGTHHRRPDSDRCAASIRLGCAGHETADLVDLAPQARRHFSSCGTGLADRL